MSQVKTVIVSPLDWGLGHATRMCQLIDQFMVEGYMVHLAGSGKSITWLCQRYPSLPVFCIKGKPIRYSNSGLSWLASLKLIYTFYYNFLKEKKFARLNQVKFDIIVSDNRYGLAGLKKENTQVSIFVTHQPFPEIKTRLKILGRKLNTILLKYINLYDYCLIPDFAGEINLSGKLSHHVNMPPRTYYIGPLSRFHNYIPTVKYCSEFWVCVIISGPEPFRSSLENEFKVFLGRSGKKCVIISGCNEKSETGRITVHGNPADDEFVSYLLCSEYVVSLAGYSSLMDLFTLGIKALIFPTPGQSEQEYLCKSIDPTFFETFENLDILFEYLENISRREFINEIADK